MKQRIVFIIAFALILTNLDAQEVAKESHWSNTVETRFGSNIKDMHHLGFVEMTASPGYKFNNRFSLRLPVELSVGMFNPSSTKNYDVLGTLGLNLAYNIVKNKNYRLEMNLSSGSTYFKSDWSYLYGDATLRFGFAGLGLVNSYMGLGVKYYHPYQSTMSDIVALCFTFGVWMF